MLKWLTRNDGSRMARAKRRLKSPRGSVFSEFALVVPIVVMLCSALIEVIGFWDAQVMANHAAWTVGRIAMVRGSDGLAFFSGIDKKSKTGIPGSDMPESIKTLIEQLNSGIAGANKLLNNRANLATMLLMSTCGIGYYGASPGQTISDAFNKLVDGAVQALVKGVPDIIAAALTKIDIPIGGGGTGIDALVRNLVKGLLERLVDAALKPVAESIAEALKEGFENLIGKGGIKIDDLFNGKSGLARFARQIYGSGSRIVRANSTIGKEVVTVEDMDALKGSFLFAKNSPLGRLAYPQVVDSEAKSDGYMVTGVHGWPANNGGLAMIHVEINWPYEYGWVFPVVSGYGTASSKPPVATGHSMVFPQPDIQNEHLYSEGATAFDPGSYTNNPAMADLDDLAKEMKDYLKYVKYGMRYRICEDTISLGDEAWYAYSWKRCNELKALFGIGDGKGGGDYADCWSAITDGKAQDALKSDLKGYFETGSYRYRDYYYWDCELDGKGNKKPHRRYSQGIVNRLGNAGLTAWYDGGDGSNGLAYNNSTANRYKRSVVPLIGTRKAFDAAYRKRAAAITAACGGLVNADMVYDAVVRFAERNKVNVHNVVKWVEGHDLAAWKEQDKEVRDTAEKAEKSFRAIRDLLKGEIRDIEDMENGTSQWTGDEDDPVFDPNDEAVMKDPAAAAKKAREKWNTMKANLKKKLGEIDDAAVALRNQWTQYCQDCVVFETERAKCVDEYFAEGCIAALIRAKGVSVFNNDSAFSIPAGAMSYDIGKGTREMLDKVRAYYDKLVKSYNLEVEYGAMMGLQSAGKAKRDGKPPDQVVDEADAIDEDTPGSLAPGSDPGAIIDKDHQTYDGGGWKWN